MISLLIYKQNQQLIEIIYENEKIKKGADLIPSQNKIMQSIQEYVTSSSLSEEDEES